MLGRKLALAAAAVAVACAAVAVPAYASWVFTGANVQGYYGTEVDLTPQVTTQTVPGDKYDVQIRTRACGRPTARAWPSRRPIPSVSRR
jgi:hypothetical protein